MRSLSLTPDGRWLLYDNREDPYQMHNLVDDPSHAKLSSDLHGVMLDWIRKAHDPFPGEALRNKRSGLTTDRA